MSDDMNEDEVVRQMQEDDRRAGGELVEELGLLREFATPRNYALARDMVPQQVYYYIRRGVIPAYKCLCGGTVVDEVEADKLLAEHKAKKDPNTPKGADG